MLSHGVLLRTDGTEEPVQAANEKAGFTLEEMYQLLGYSCDIVQMIYLVDGREMYVRKMYVDEEAKLKRTPPPPNPKATRLLAQAGRRDVVLGNALVLGVARHWENVG